MRASLSELTATFAEAPPKGEVVLVIGAAAEGAGLPEAEDLDARLAALVAEHGVNRAASALARETGLKRADLYRRALDLTRGGPADDA